MPRPSRLIPPHRTPLTFLRAARFRPNLEPEAAMHREIVNDRLKLIYHRLAVRRLAHDSSLIDDARKVVA